MSNYGEGRAVVAILANLVAERLRNRLLVKEEGNTNRCRQHKGGSRFESEGEAVRTARSESRILKVYLGFPALTTLAML